MSTLNRVDHVLRFNVFDQKRLSTGICARELCETEQAR